MLKKKMMNTAQISANLSGLNGFPAVSRVDVSSLQARTSAGNSRNAHAMTPTNSIGRKNHHASTRRCWVVVKR